ncbi:MAG: hypothetical protein QW474_01205, partial [Candidatus Aenigmatarchaeota archaeon]
AKKIKTNLNIYLSKAICKFNKFCGERFFCYHKQGHIYEYNLCDGFVCPVLKHKVYCDVKKIFKNK